MTFQFHSNYADFEVGDPHVFAYFVEHAMMTQTAIVEDIRVLICVDRMLYDMSQSDLYHMHEQRAYAICQDAHSVNVDYLIVEYIGDISRLPTHNLN
ncbi:MAG: hypothetical protein ACFE0Q_01175 [Anaerolineae bacterium]